MAAYLVQLLNRLMRNPPTNPMTYETRSPASHPKTTASLAAYPGIGRQPISNANRCQLLATPNDQQGCSG